MSLNDTTTTAESIDSTDSFSVIPPVPPPNINLGDGRFDYIDCIRTRNMLQNGWNAVNITESWNFLREHKEAFTFSDSPQVNNIYNKMEELGYNGHSGCSFALTIRTLQFIARKGEPAYRKEWTRQQR